MKRCSKTAPFGRVCTIEQVFVLSRDNVINVEDLPITLQNNESEKISLSEGSFQERVEAFEKHLISDALQEANSVQTGAAQLPGMSERHLRYKLQKY